MNFARILQLGVLVLIAMGLQIFAGHPPEFFGAAIRGALEDKKAEQQEASASVVKPSNIRSMLPSIASVQKGLSDGLTYAQSIEYKKNVKAALKYFREIGFVRTSWSWVREKYWQVPVILPEQQIYSSIFVFGPARDETVFACPVTDGYTFVVPERAIATDFLPMSICADLEPIVHDLKRAGIDISSRVMYLLCSIRQLQLSNLVRVLDQSSGSVQDIQAFFHAHQKELGRIALQLNDKELFDAIKACRSLEITNSYFLNALSYVVANALCSKHPLETIAGMLDRELVLFRTSREMLVRSLRNVIIKSKIFGEEIVLKARAVAGDEDDRASVATEPAVVKSEKKPARKKKKRF